MSTVEKYFDAKTENISEGISFLADKLKSAKVNSKESIKAQLLAEEFLAKIISSKSEEDSDKIRVALTKVGKKVSVIVSFKGKKIKDINNIGLGLDLSASEMSPDMEATIRDMIINANSDSVIVSYKNGINKISIFVGKSKGSELKILLFSLLISIIIGIAFKLLLPENVNAFIDEKILSTIKTLFLNAFKLVTGPVIFFSVASCISMFNNMSEMGKTAAKVIAFYLTTTLIALAISLLTFFIFSPGSFGELAGMGNGELVDAPKVNAVDMITGIIPENFFLPFIELNTLQLMVIAIFVGFAATKMGNKAGMVSGFLNNANELFQKITTIFAKFIFVMLIVSVISLIIQMDIENIKTIVGVVLVMFLCFGLMFIIYNLLVAILTKTSPIFFIKNSINAWINAMITQSSSASMPNTLEVCRRLKISPKIYSFSIPLGTTINMDGAVIALAVTALFMAKVFGVELTVGSYITLIIMVVILSVSMPGVPGATLVCLSMLFSQFNIPMEALTVFLGYYAIIDPFLTANNVYGDVTGSYIVAKRAGLMDK